MHAAKGVEPELHQPDVLADDEPKYLRRQKPVEIRRRKFGKQARRTYLRWMVAVAALTVMTTLFYVVGDFLLNSPRMALLSPDQVVVRGNVAVTRAAVLERFYADRERSVLRIPLDQRRAELEQIPWVERASVRRVLPNRIEVELAERKPIALLRLGAELALIDAHGVILDRRPGGDYRFPVVTGVHEAMPLEERQLRMQMYAQFLEGIEQVRPRASERVSEVDLADATDLRAVLADLPELAGPGGQLSVLVHFGDGNFAVKYRTFVENIRQWRASTGRVESVDLRFERQVVVNPEARP